MHSTFSNSCCVCICCGSYSEHWREKPVCLRTMHRWDRWVDCTLLHRRRSTGRDGWAFPYVRFSETSKYHIARQPLFHLCRLFVCYVLIIQFWMILVIFCLFNKEVWNILGKKIICKIKLGFQLLSLFCDFQRLKLFNLHIRYFNNDIFSLPVLVYLDGQLLLCAGPASTSLLISSSSSNSGSIHLRRNIDCQDDKCMGAEYIALTQFSRKAQILAPIY